MYQRWKVAQSVCHTLWVLHSLSMTQLALGLFRGHRTVVAEKQRARISTGLLCCVAFNGQRRLVATGGAPLGTTSGERYYRRDQTQPMHRRLASREMPYAGHMTSGWSLLYATCRGQPKRCTFSFQPISIFRQVCSIELNQCESRPRKSPDWPSMMYALLEMRLARR